MFLPFKIFLWSSGNIINHLKLLILLWTVNDCLIIIEILSASKCNIQNWHKSENHSWMRWSHNQSYFLGFLLCFFSLYFFVFRGGVFFFWGGGVVWWGFWGVFLGVFLWCFFLCFCFSFWGFFLRFPNEITAMMYKKTKYKKKYWML